MIDKRELTDGRTDGRTDGQEDCTVVVVGVENTKLNRAGLVYTDGNTKVTTNIKSDCDCLHPSKPCVLKFL